MLTRSAGLKRRALRLLTADILVSAVMVPGPAATGTLPSGTVFERSEKLGAVAGDEERHGGRDAHTRNGPR